MDVALKWAVAVAVLAFHVWACGRRPRYWYLGGMIPLIWLGLLGVLWYAGRIHWGRDWAFVIFPTLILILFWIRGQQLAKKREMARMKAKDIWEE